MKDFLTIKEFAIELNLHYNTVLRAIRSGRINAFRVTDAPKGAFRIPRTEILKIASDDFKKMRGL
jgi:excisionase family DNA binding protein